LKYREFSAVNRPNDGDKHAEAESDILFQSEFFGR
jgi:hypothetical protein